MKNVGEFCGLKIWVPDTGDVISDQESFNLLKYHLEQLFPMVPVTPPNIQNEEPKIQPAPLKQQAKVQICPECRGSGYTVPTLQDPDGLCPKCRGEGKL